jgi:gliding motility-associated-like protein
VNPVPTVNAGPDTTVCPGVNYVMASASSVTTVNWSPATGLNVTDSLNPVFNYDSNQVYVLTASAGGCKRSDTVDIKVIGILLNPGADTTVCFGELDTLNASSSSENIVWSPPSGANLSDSVVLNPVFSSTDAGKFLLVLTARDSGCALSKQVTITVDECNTYLAVPSAFSPNGDGMNDYFTVFGKYIEEYQIRIFNRWGEEVYSSNDVSELNNPERGWDGTYKGKKQDPGAYAYYISARDINGKDIFKKGDLVLIR